jgi:hypothetical protein
MQYKQRARVNFGIATEPDHAIVERICPQVIIVRWEDTAGKMTMPIRVFEALVTPITENAP